MMGIDEAQLKDINRITEDHNRNIITEIAKDRIASTDNFKAFLNIFKDSMVNLVSAISKDCVKGTSNERRIETLEREMGEGRGDIKEMKEKLLGRPTWAVCIIISILCMVSTASITWSMTVFKVYQPVLMK
jgi:hypothetical protein